MTNEQIIWDYFFSKLKNAYGTAALMGNFMAESSLNPICANGVKKLGLTNEQYTEIADLGKNNNFITDGIAYGLVQWCYKTRKQGLLKFAKEQQKSVGDLNLQLDYIWQELQKYKTVLNALYDATNIKVASDIVMLKYEKPSNKSEAMKERRAKYGQKYFDKYGYDIDLTVAFKSAGALFESLEQSLKNE